MRLNTYAVTIILFLIPEIPNSIAINQHHQDGSVILYSEKLNSNYTISELIPSPLSQLKQSGISDTEITKPLTNQESQLSNLKTNDGDLNSTLSVLALTSVNETLEAAEVQLAKNETNSQPLNHTSEHLENPITPNIESEDVNRDDEGETTFKFRGPNPYIKKVDTTTETLSEEDRMVRNTWGGNCLSEHWKHCNKINCSGGDYYIKDKKNPGKLILKYHCIPCFSDVEKYYCLMNNWTVARCHMICMANLCNNEYRQKYDQLVRHEGECQFDS